MAEGTAPGSLLDGRYLLVQRLGTGGAATVWQAEDLQTRSEVAVKLLHPRGRTDRRMRNRFLREADFLCALEHPGIARLLDFSVDAAMPYLVIELIRGGTFDHVLAHHAQQNRHFSTAEVLALFSGLCAALAYAHRQGVVHRDLKPANLMVVEERAMRVKILDFGVAKLMDEAGEGTTQGRIVGSLGYLAPEQAQGEAVDGRADVFALGCLLFEVLTLRRAWGRADDGAPLPACEAMRPNAYNRPLALLERIVREPRPRPSAFRPGLDPRLDALVLAALAIRPGERVVSADAFLEMLEAVEAWGDTRTAAPTEMDTAAVQVHAERTASQGPATEIRSAAPPAARTPRPQLRRRRRSPTSLLPVVGALLAGVLALALTLVLRAPQQTGAAQAPPPAAAPQVQPRAELSAPPLPELVEPPSREAGPERGPRLEPVRLPRPAPPPEPARNAPPTPAPVEAAPPPGRAAMSALRAELASLEEPAPPARLVELGEHITRATALVASERARARIRRLASSGATLGDRASLERAVEELSQALAEQ